MIPVEYFVSTIVGLGVLNYSVAHLLLREIRALSRALIANNSKDLVMLENVASKARSVPKRHAPEREEDFTDTRLRALGL